MSQKNIKSDKAYQAKIKELELQLNEEKKRADELFSQRSAAITWAIFYENHIRYKMGNEEIARIQFMADKEIPRLLNEGWPPEMAKRFMKGP